MNPKLVTKRDDSDPNTCFRYFEFCEKLEVNTFRLDYLGFFPVSGLNTVETEGEIVTIDILCVLILKVCFFK